MPRSGMDPSSVVARIDVATRVPKHAWRDENPRYWVGAWSESYGPGTGTLRIAARGTDEILMASHDSSGTAQAVIARR